ncbi:hemin uptake protein HemP [Mesorhizobium yinganensis]|uniref:hemin uptake protein HemP n=1 Tax=Mesorhizobium yinganensis TaxID=3157707 RepID=UPI0032B7C4D7
MNTHNPNAFFRARPYPTEGVQRPEFRRPAAVRTLTSQSLFQGEFEIGIDHGGSLYRLKITRQGKLILNK